MLVTNKNLQDVLQSYSRTTAVQTDRARSAQSGQAAAPAKRDAVQLSAGAVEIQRALTVLRNSPEVRQDLVNALRSDIEAGTFRVNLEEIANQLMLVV